MLTRDGQTINRETAAHKYGGDPLAEYLYWLSLDSTEDEASGDVEAPTGWFARFGKRLLHCDERGFIAVVRYASPLDARRAFEMLDDEFIVWCDEEQFDDDQRARQLEALRAARDEEWRLLQRRRQARYQKG